MRIDSRIVNLALANVFAPLEANVRDTDGYALEPLMADLAMRGQEDAITVFKKSDGSYEVVKGFRRTLALKNLEQQGVIDPSTMKVDGDGKFIEGSGKPFSTVKAIVITDATPLELARAKVDHGQQKSLNKAELQRAADFLFMSGMTEGDVTVTLYPLLQAHYPAPELKGIESSEAAQKAKEHYRGTVQNMHKVAEMPTIARDAYFKRLRGAQSWPTQGSIKKLHAAWVKDRTADKVGEFNVDKPGPEFLKVWDELVEGVKQAEAEGKRPPTVATHTKKQIEAARDNAKSRFGKMTLNWVLNDGIKEEAILTIDAALAELEKSVSEEVWAELTEKILRK